MPNQAIARGTVAIYKDHLGRGPTTAWTIIQGDVVTTICTDGLTRAEATLVAQGDQDMVRVIRRKFQTAMADDLMALVERETGRKSRTLLSDHDVVKDIMCETVVLEPAS